MKATELYLEGGKSAGIFFCGECRIVHRTQAEAEACCVPQRCRCGSELPRGWLTCHVCRKCDAAKKEALQYAAAAKTPAADWTGPVWCDVNTNDGFFANVEALLEHFFDEEDLPAHVFACKTHPICWLDYDRIIEDATQEAYEEWTSDSLTGEAELTAALDAFNEKNKDNVYWTVDYSRAVVLDRTREPSATDVQGSNDGPT